MWGINLPPPCPLIYQAVPLYAAHCLRRVRHAALSLTYTTLCAEHAGIASVHGAGFGRRKRASVKSTLQQKPVSGLCCFPRSDTATAGFET